MDMKGQIAKEYFLKGYNCAQAVCLAFKEEVGLDETTLLKVASSFGGGLGRLREVCGAVSGMAIILGLKYGYTGETDHEGKTAHYKRIQEVVGEFKAKNGSYICKELINQKPSGFEPEKRTEEYYKKRACGDLVSDAAEILEEYIKNN
ncbi:MAG: C_GCAxxG_C_C family protein [Clostridia bacterium]|nr:C_GCAxxG_C_C family protein [Clostridia bacterium]